MNFDEYDGRCRAACGELAVSAIVRGLAPERSSAITMSRSRLMPGKTTMPAFMRASALGGVAWGFLAWLGVGCQVEGGVVGEFGGEADIPRFRHDERFWL